MILQKTMCKLGSFQASKDINNEEEKNKRYLDEMIKSSTVHGFSHLLRSKRLVSKVLWFILFAAGIIASITCTWASVNEYFQYNVMTQLREIEEAEVTFPAITICNMNKFSSEQAISLIKEISLEENFDYFDEKTFFKNPNLTLSEKQYTIWKLNDLIFAKIKKRNFTDEQIQSLSYSMKDMIFTCWGIDRECQFEWMNHREFGNCYRINTGFNKNGEKVELLKARSSNSRQLYIELYAGLNFYC